MRVRVAVETTGLGGGLLAEVQGGGGRVATEILGD